MNRFLLCLLLFTLSVRLIAQDPGEDLLAWSPFRKLSWSDYKASPNPASDAAATTTTYLSIDYHISGNNFSYTIKSWFSRTLSWGRHKSNYILSHEQGHFDIAEIYARELNRRMSEYRFDSNSYRKELKKIYDEVTGEKAGLQEQYDRETQHSINKEKQAEWEKKIRSMLEELKDYADY